MKGRIQRIFKEMGQEVDAIVLMNDVDPNLDTFFPYFTGTFSGLFEEGLAIAWPDGTVDLICSPLEETSARQSWSKVHIYQKKEKERIMRRVIGRCAKVGVNAHGLSLHSYNVIQGIFPKMTLVDISEDLARIKNIKDKEEIKLLREACRITSMVADQIPDFLTAGMTENEAAAELNYRMMKAGASGLAFDTNASFGANSAEPHHQPDGSKAKKNDIALFDFGACHRKYGADLTRTYFLGRATKWQMEMYRVVLEAQEAAIEAIRPGVNGKDVDAIARKIIDASAFKGRFIHSLGHSIGLSVHDGMRMAPKVDLVLSEGMVLTVEPGVYIPEKGGVRIEDDIVVTKKGCELLTHAKKELRVI